jgi:hypothetical protein
MNYTGKARKYKIKIVDSSNGSTTTTIYSMLPPNTGEVTPNGYNIVYPNLTKLAEATTFNYNTQLDLFLPKCGLTSEQVTQFKATSEYETPNCTIRITSSWTEWFGGYCDPNRQNSYFEYKISASVSAPAGTYTLLNVDSGHSTVFTIPSGQSSANVLLSGNREFYGGVNTYTIKIRIDDYTHTDTNVAVRSQYTAPISDYCANSIPAGGGYFEGV